jgi:hypothetical protein
VVILHRCFINPGSKTSEEEIRVMDYYALEYGYNVALLLRLKRNVYRHTALVYGVIMITMTFQK